MPRQEGSQTAGVSRSSSAPQQSGLNAANVRRWLTLAGGGALAAYGLTRRSKSGAALAVAGSALAVYGVRTQRTNKRGIHIQRSIHIARPVEEVYRFWRNFENFPKFMRHLKSVTTTGDRYSHWIARAPMGAGVEWDAEVIEEQPNRFLVWKSLPGAMIPNLGSVEFREGDQYHSGTEISVVLEYQPPAGAVGAAFARMLGEEPDQQIREDLRRLKQLLETGEVATTEGQPHGRRTPFVRMVQAVASDEPRPEEPRFSPQAV